MLHKYMNISRVLVYAQSTEDSKLSWITDILRGVETNVCFGSAKDDHKMRDSSTISDKGKEPTKNPFQGTINIPPSRGHSLTTCLVDLSNKFQFWKN